MKRKQYIIVGLLAFLNFTFIIDFVIMMPLSNILMPKWDIGTSAFSHIAASYSVAAFTSNLMAIFFADKFDRKYILIIAYSLFLLGTICCGLANGPKTLLLARIATGLFGGIISSQLHSIIGDIIPYENRGQAMGLLFAGFGLASVLGVPLGLYLANHYSWSFPFYAIFGIGLLIIPLLLKYLPNINLHIKANKTAQQILKDIYKVFSNRLQLIALLFSLLLVTGHYIVIPLINPYLVHNVSLEQKQTPLIYFAGGLSSLITSQIIGVLADKFGKRKVFIIAATISMISVILITHMPQLSLPLVLTIFVFWFSASTARTVPGNAMVTQVVKPENRGSFQSINSCFQQLGTGTATLLSSWITFSDTNLKVFNYNYLGYISIGIIFICIVLVSYIDKGINNQTGIN